MHRAEDGDGVTRLDDSRCFLNVREFNGHIGDTIYYFVVLNLKESLFVWVGTENKFSNCAVAMVSDFNPKTLSSRLFGSIADSASLSLASKLSACTGKQVDMSFIICPEALF